jgi:hypothetical protein
VVASTDERRGSIEESQAPWAPRKSETNTIAKISQRVTDTSRHRQKSRFWLALPEFSAKRQYVDFGIDSDIGLIDPKQR